MSPRIIVENISDHPKETLFTVQKNEQLHYIAYGFVTGEKRIVISLEGEGAIACITGLIIGNAGACAVHTLQRHVAPHTTSDLLVKTALGGSAGFQYHGAIAIEKQAQHANAYQRNENVLLNPGAHVDTKPELEIQANEVRCTHGATVGKLDDEALFYLRSRGLQRQAAEALALEGFLGAALKRIPDFKTQNKIRKYIRQQFQNV